MKNKNLTRHGVITISILLVVTLFFLAVFFSLQIKSASLKAASDNQKMYVNHILLAGNHSDADMLNKIYEGACSTSEKHNAVVEKLFPLSRADTRTITTWTDYASYVDADGIIIFSDDETQSIAQPVNVYGSQIPVVTLINSNPENSEIFFLGTNKYEIGKSFAHEILAFEKSVNSTVKHVVALINIDKNVSSSDRILASIQEEFISLKNKNIIIHTASISNSNSGSVNDEIRKRVQEFIEQYNEAVILCFSADETIITAQTLIDLNLTAQAGIIGLYENNMTKSYIEKGIIFSVITVDAFSMGVQAMENLFSWKKDGYTNSYGSTDIIIFRKGSAQ